MKICDLEKCTGCRLCADVCPVNAITFKKDEKGFIFPQINDSCIKCNLCKKNCPSNNQIVVDDFEKNIMLVGTKAIYFGLKVVVEVFSLY